MSQVDSFDDSHAITLFGTAGGAAERQLRPGDVIGGSYKLKSLLGAGGMGYVFCAEHIIIHHDYALKMLAPEQLNAESRRRFESEGRAIAKLDHANIVKVYNMGLDQHHYPFYVMDLLQGVPLSAYIAEKKKLPLAETLSLMIQIASGLGYAHGKGLVHRDVKPSNIILVQDGEGGHTVKIVDFGIAKAITGGGIDGQSQTKTGAVFGSPLYMSPEQSMGSAIDQRTDIYSMGCTFFEALSGKPPFHGQNAMVTVMMHQTRPVPSLVEACSADNLPAAVDTLLAKMMAKDPADRYQSMEQLGHDLIRVAQAKPIGKEAAVVAIASAAGTAGGVVRDSEAGSTVADKGQSDGSAAAVSASVKAALGQKYKPVFVSGLIFLVIGAGILSLFFCFQPWSGAKHDYTLSGGRPTRVAPKSSSISDTESVARADDEGLVDPVNLEMESDKDRESARVAFEKCQEIKSTPVMINGRKGRHFIFPGWPIGTVSNVAGESCEAKDAQNIVETGYLRLEIGYDRSREVLFLPAIVDKIGRDEFNQLAVASNPATDLGNNFSGRQTKTAGVVHILRTALGWPRLAGVKLASISLSSEVLDCLNKLDKTKYLELEEPIVDINLLARQPFLRQRSVLVFSRFDELGSGDVLKPVFDALAGSSKLEVLQLYKCNMTPETLIKVRSCRKLNALILDEEKLDELLPVIANLHSVSLVSFPKTKLTSAQIAQLTSCQHIKSVNLSVKQYSESEMASYRYDGSKVNFGKF